MSPHRLTTICRYRVSNDVLILILEWLDPKSLYNACKVIAQFHLPSYELIGLIMHSLIQAFRRIYSLAMEYQTLRYKFELAVSAMCDGRAPRSAGSPHARLQLLLTYRKDWPRLSWTHEYKMQVSSPAHVGVSEGFIHQIRTHGAYNILELTELASCRTGRPPKFTRHLKYTTPEIEAVSIDSSQALIVTSHIFWYGSTVFRYVYDH